jgi:hypothetical protein
MTHSFNVTLCGFVDEMPVKAKKNVTRLLSLLAQTATLRTLEKNQQHDVIIRSPA